VRYAASELLFEGQSEFQNVKVVQTTGFGKMLLNDNLVMVTEKDEFVYHDMIAHVPLFVHPNPKRVLIIGGGDGGTAREVIRHASVEKCVMVEVDQMVVEACKQHIPLTAAALADPRVDLRIEDGVKFMKDSDQTFDVILVDSTDPIGPATPLFGEEFYKDVFARLSDEGIVVSQGESPFYEQKMQKKLVGLVKPHAKHFAFYNFHNMTYPGGLWSFLFASKKYHPVADFDAARVGASGLKFQYYNEEIHKGAFDLPEFQKQVLKSE
jgi:spermidine synthase